jgi:hypothetical protein
MLFGDASRELRELAIKGLGAQRSRKHEHVQLGL